MRSEIYGIAKALPKASVKCSTVSNRQTWAGLCALTLSFVIYFSSLNAHAFTQPDATGEKTDANAKSMQDNETQIVYIDAQRSTPAGTPLYLARPVDEGILGANLGIEDANITGRFLGYSLSLTHLPVFSTSSAIDSDNALFNAPSTDAITRSDVVLLDSTDAKYQVLINAILSINPNALIINVASGNDAFRHQQCDAYVLHTFPSHQMKTDALGQWLRTKRVNAMLTLQGTHDSDQAYLAAFLRTAKKFKIDIVESKVWQASFDLRRSAFSEIPLFTRTKKPYDAIFAADTQGQYAYSLPFNTHLIVPIIGSAGLKPLGWHFTHEQWGARQLQNRFKEKFSRNMNDVDFAAYAAIIAISTALQQSKLSGTGSSANDSLIGTQLFNALVEEQLSIAAYKGRQLTFRKGTRQLRQPIALAHEEALVIHAPLPGFLHQSDELDTLGETNKTCKDPL
ncbi:MAG: ABC transporter substrate binding protein (PQQ-dependent alcohol dehydrogenase system) [Alteromonadaceae bacterium]|jgi:ABC transporter substrate binding protein (PQQ-dependent alcohol dehydrogenase system)